MLIHWPLVFRTGQFNNTVYRIREKSGSWRFLLQIS
jgi:hypothetical protein